jgi:hypothetical protein
VEKPAALNPQLYCHLNPPTVNIIPLPDGNGSLRPQAIAAFPPVQPNQWCSHWQPGILIALN